MNRRKKKGVVALRSTLVGFPNLPNLPQPLGQGWTKVEGMG